MCVCVCMYIYIETRAYSFIPALVPPQPTMCVSTLTRIDISYMYIHTYIHIYTYRYMCVYICI